MPSIKFSALTTGLAPAVAPELLPDSGAQIATNCRLLSGDIEPLRAGVGVFATAVTGAIKTIFRINEAAGTTWLAWNNEVSCVKGPITGLGRYYFTGVNEPRVTTYALATAGGGNNYPAQYRALGVPAPANTLSVSPSGGVGAAVSRYYCFTFYDDWNQESARSPLSALVTGKVDDTWAIGNMDATPPNSGDINALTYAGTTVTITTTNAHYNRAGDTIVIAGVTTVTNVNGTWVLTAVNTTAKTMTFVTGLTPSGTYNNATDTTDTWSRAAPFGTCTKRLYRTSGTTAQFQMVATGISGTTFNDNLPDGSIPGDTMITGDWYLPPVDLDGLVMHPSGSMVGFSGNTLYLSEPYQLHAFPTKYTLRTDYNIKALAVYGNNIIVATTGMPYIVYGSAPGQMGIQKLNSSYPCLAKRSMVSTLTGAVYSSQQGLVQVSDAGADIITANMYEKHQWNDLNPTLMIGAFSSGELFYAAFPSNAPASILIFGSAHVQAQLNVTALYTDPQDGVLYYMVSGDNNIYAFDKATGQYMPQDWKSKELYLTEPRTMTAARVMFNPALSAAQITTLQSQYNTLLASNQALVATHAVGGALDGDALNGQEVNGDDLQYLPNITNASAQVSFQLYADGNMIYSTTVNDSNAFRLPSGYTALKYAVRVSSTSRIKSIELADNMVALKNV